ncbi:NAD(P)/FAD-dependent oxidoreductase [Amycolatopsis sp. lyj-109]|uniref:FAD/NAD(P)-dependent oxidoreductase n=1 Tax=Amycolatopsis sp. lyj-109 TaxID=2789287 RepID=UPI003979F3A8
MTHVVIVGAGPAGLAAAEHALAAGADVTVLDQADAPGGQYHRGASHRFAALLDRCRWWPESTVWALEGKRVHVLRGPVDGTNRRRCTLEPDALVLATGAHDRVLPFPGWQMPGVFTAGAAQALAKGERVAAGRRVLVAGAGPFLLPVAASLVAVGAELLAVLEANPARTVLSGWSWRAAGHVGKMNELVRYAGTLARHRVPYRMGRAVIEARGEDRVREAVTARVRADWSVVPGTERTYEVDALCVGHGFVPQPELAVAAGCILDGGFVRVGDDQRTSVTGVFAAGELTGIGGSGAAAAEGAVAGWAAAGRTPGRALLRRRDHARAFARRLAAAHPIGAAWPDWLREDTVVCRCEETTCGDLKTAAANPVAPGQHALKLGTRAGLGPCQGRMCGPAVAELCGGVERHHRPIAQPIRLGELADPKEFP